MWIKVLEHDENGAATYGDIAILRDAVAQGAEVQVRIFEPDGREFTAQQVFGVTVKDDRVFLDGVGISNNIGSNSIAPELYYDPTTNKPYKLYFIAGTNGHLHRNRWDLAATEIRKDNETRRMAWYVGP